MVKSIEKQRLIQVIKELGRKTVHQNFPNEVEFYSMAFEVVKSNGEVDGFFVMPILPSSIQISSESNASVNRTFGGTVTFTNGTFNPIRITLNGNFGRKLRILLKNGDVLAGSAFESTLSNFSANAKTGYGATKILEAMLDKSITTDEFGKPYRLFFYNMAFNQSYQVILNQMNFSQNEGTSNMIWEYQIDMTAVAYANQTRSDNELSVSRNLNKSYVQKVFERGLGVAANVVNNSELIENGILKIIR